LITAEFGRDLFSRDGKYHNEDEALFNSSRALRAKAYFEDLQHSSRGKTKLYKDILARGYNDYFTNGFSLK